MPLFRFHFYCLIVLYLKSSFLLVYTNSLHVAGEILLRNSNPMEAPVIQPNYLQEDRDAKVIVEGNMLITV